MEQPPAEQEASKLAIWIKRLGFWGIMFFLIKGLMWLIVPALIAYFSVA